MRMVVLLPAPLGAQEAEDHPGRDGQGDPLDRLEVAELLAYLL